MVIIIVIITDSMYGERSKHSQQLEQAATHEYEKSETVRTLTLMDSSKSTTTATPMDRSCFERRCLYLHEISLIEERMPGKPYRCFRPIIWTAVREVPGSNRAVGSCVYRITTVIYTALGTGCAHPSCSA